MNVETNAKAGCCGGIFYVEVCTDAWNDWTRRDDDPDQASIPCQYGGESPILAAVDEEVQSEATYARSSVVSFDEPIAVLSDADLLLSMDAETPAATPPFVPAPSRMVAPSIVYTGMMSDNDTNDEWDPVFQRIHSHPQEIGLRSRDGGLNAIHAACVRYPPSRIIRAMLNYAADAALQQNNNGETPLHLASYSASEEVQAMLVRERPQAAKIVDQYGDLPLHFAARAGATPRLMEQFLYAYPEGINQENLRGATPFWLLPRSYLEAEDLDEILEEENEDYRDDWDLLVLFLRYFAFGREARNMPRSKIEDYETWIVHAAASCPACPVDVLTFLCRMFPSQAVRYNSSGCTPLLLACQTPDIHEPSA